LRQAPTRAINYYKNVVIQAKTVLTIFQTSEKNIFTTQFFDMKKFLILMLTLAVFIELPNEIECLDKFDLFLDQFKPKGLLRAYELYERLIVGMIEKEKQIQIEMRQKADAIRSKAIRDFLVPRAGSTSFMRDFNSRF